MSDHASPDAHDRDVRDLTARDVTVHVPLDAGRDYDIRIGRGLLDGIGEAIAPLGARAVGIVTDETVADL